MNSFQMLATLEILIVNLFTSNRCCRKKYPAAATVFVLAGFTAVLVLASAVLVRLPLGIVFYGDSRLFFLGFIYLIPYRILYRDKLGVLFILMCSCWVYTMGVYALSYQIAAVFADGNILCLLAVESVLFMSSLLTFYRKAILKYVFVIENLQQFRKQWYYCIAVNSCITFFLVAVLHTVFIREDGSLLKVLGILLVLSSVFLSYYILYRILCDSLEMNRLEAEIARDPLTGAGSRSRLWDDLKALTVEDGEFSLLFMDLDRFKQINDQFGHITGDEYLRHFAEITERVLHGIGRVYRFGGDEFVAVIRGGISGALMDRVRECREWEENAPCPFNGVSVGKMICRPPHGETEEILKQVDRLMYENKMRKYQRRTEEEQSAQNS